MQPAGWFFEWEGFGHLFFRSKEGMKDLTLYRTMTKVANQEKNVTMQLTRLPFIDIVPLVEVGVPLLLEGAG
jgi:hypothetical protein